MGGGAGNDGGTIIKSRDAVKVKKVDYGAKDREKALLLDRWTTCALSGEPLSEPVVCDELGNLLNKEAVLHLLLEKKELPAFSHIKSLKKDVVVLKRGPAPSGSDGSTGRGQASSSATAHEESRKPAFFVCPITLIEATGTAPFLAFRACGCVVSEKAVRELKTAACPACGKEAALDGPAVPIIRLCPSEEEQAKLRTSLIQRRKAATAIATSAAGASTSAAAAKAEKRAHGGSDSAAAAAESEAASAAASASRSAGAGGGAAADGKLSGHKRGHAERCEAQAVTQAARGSAGAGAAGEAHSARDEAAAEGVEGAGVGVGAGHREDRTAVKVARLETGGAAAAATAGVTVDGWGGSDAAVGSVHQRLPSSSSSSSSSGPSTSLPPRSRFGPAPAVIPSVAAGGAGAGGGATAAHHAAAASAGAAHSLALSAAQLAEKEIAEKKAKNPVFAKLFNSSSSAGAGAGSNGAAGGGAGGTRNDLFIRQARH